MVCINHISVGGECSEQDCDGSDENCPTYEKKPSYEEWKNEMGII